MGDRTMKKRALPAMIAALTLGACAGSPLSKEGFMETGIGMSHDNTILMQRPTYPNSHIIAWDLDDRFHQSVTLDYISGLSQRSYFFAEPNQAVFRPMLLWSLDRSGLQAPTRTAARYGLQVEFIDIDSNAFGTSMAGRSTAIYRIVDRASGRVVYEDTVRSNFLAIPPGLNEDDANTAYGISMPPLLATQASFGTFAVGDGVVVETINNVRDLRHFFDGPLDEATQATWNDAYQGYLWGTGLSALSGPVLVGLAQLNPLNYVAFGDYHGTGPKAPVRGALKGPLSESGIASRNGTERGRQLNQQMLAQSITKFLIRMADAEDVKLTLMVPCLASDELDTLRQDIILSGHAYRTDDCTAYQRRDKDGGFGFNGWAG